MTRADLSLARIVSAMRTMDEVARKVEELLCSALGDEAVTPASQESWSWVIAEHGHVYLEGEPPHGTVVVQPAGKAPARYPVDAHDDAKLEAAVEDAVHVLGA